MDLLGIYYIGFYLTLDADVSDYYNGDVDAEQDDDMMYYVTKHHYNSYSNVKDIAKIEDIVIANPSHFTDKFMSLDVNDMNLIDY